MQEIYYKLVLAIGTALFAGITAYTIIKDFTEDSK